MLERRSVRSDESQVHSSSGGLIDGLVDERNGIIDRDTHYLGELQQRSTTTTAQYERY